MGGRGKAQDNSENRYDSDNFGWVKDVSDQRLKNYIKRARHIGLTHGSDPEGRSIHILSYYAEKELANRGKSK